ncbi:hypothetical protein BJY04DRAFT_223309 [Aspergillus karnatakaensis]|uniref:uncharacterized protein n=1 Tax=Aspergillus karnatakaensis TaxID=1810916 RepID=UPI003CCE255F
MVFTDSLLLILYLGHTSSLSLWPAALHTFITFPILLTVLSIVFLLLRSLVAPRPLVSLSTPQQVLSKPLLIPVNFNHTRLSPIKDKFANNFLLLGVPVGISCRVGNLLAIDDPSVQDVSPPPGGGDVGFWRRARAHLRCWFSVDAVRLLHRGEYGIGLRGKLDSFLRDQNEDPTQWPHAYLLTVPKFLGFSRNVVSWWYLYNANLELDALILEINNSYFEKRNIFLRLKPSDSSPEPQTSFPTHPEATYLDPANLITSLPSTSKSKFYSGTWHKTVFASPFEKVDGLVSQRMMDPLHPSSWSSNASFSNMTTLNETGVVRMVTRLTCAGPPIDPTTISTWDLLLFLVKWSVPGVFTTFEIISKALKIKFSGKMKMHKKPPVRTGSVGREITSLELKMESFFRSYLTHAVQNYPGAVEVTYLPCRSFSNEKIIIHSRAGYGKDPSTIKNLTIEPTDPGFYTRFPNYTSPRTALEEETRELGYEADPTASRLLVSDLPLLISILEHAALRTGEKTLPFSKSGISMPMQHVPSTQRALLSLARGFSRLTFMDEFVLSTTTLPPPAKTAYAKSILHLSAAQLFTFGSPLLLTVAIILLSLITKWLLLCSLSSIMAEGGMNLVSVWIPRSDSIWSSSWSVSSTINVLFGYILIHGIWRMKAILFEFAATHFPLRY